MHASARLDRAVEDTGAKTLRYLYDFGDGWEHTVKLYQIPFIRTCAPTGVIRWT
jgi:hypothetical protein